MSSSKIDYDLIISQLKAQINTDCTIANRYGIILGSTIEEFPKGQIISNNILELITRGQLDNWIRNHR